MQVRTSRHRIQAVLGPTNTGKTHLALDRMLGHTSGMIGFPLRLLARENYDRAVRLKGRHQVALITGEEKIVPSNARYFLCTVESMPMDRLVSFLAVDEIQMCADADRGHVFTNRLLGARGADETMFMGAETVKPMLRRLVPEAELITRPRFSNLAYTGQRKVTRLPPRSAVVAFSAADVYSLAELVRRERGGAAVVLGALSPRTRNAQVELYQAGEVDYLVATDAIGMGLNMDVDHVAFAETRKFDGHAPRPLTPVELAQIAGRAGRYMNDGTFGTTADAGALDPETVDSIENHRFPALDALQWRNAELRFTSLAALRASLAKRPSVAGLLKSDEAEDELSLTGLAKDADVAARATRPDTVRLLWDVCRIPDFRKVMSYAHGRLLKRVFMHLTGPESCLPTDWVAAHVARIDRTDGDIETLVQRIANIRTWTYISFRHDWLNDAGHWRNRTRAVEDRLSDALHERLILRFVDRRTAILVSRMKDRQPLQAAVNQDGEVTVEGYFVGHLKGFRFAADTAEGRNTAARSVANAAHRALAGEIAARVGRLEIDADDALALAADGHIAWHGEAVGHLAPGPDVLRPGVEPLAGEAMKPELRERLRRRLAAWLADTVGRRLEPLLGARAAVLNGAARGLVFRLSEALGSMPRKGAEEQVAALYRADRRTLRTLGIRIGRESIYMPALIKPAAVEIRSALWSALNGRGVALPPPGRVSVLVADNAPPDFYEAVGYRPLGPLAVRVDIVERLAAYAWRLSEGGPFDVGPEFLTLAGCGATEMDAILERLGYRATNGNGGDSKPLYGRHPRRSKRSPPRSSRRPPDGPFAKLRELSIGR
jgi:ATP-dependent RNA helicase SUPV3L1/SUV3